MPQDHSVEIYKVRILKKHFLDTSKVRRIAQSVFARQVGTTALAQGVTLVLSLATAAISARWLGPVGKGQLAMILMVTSMLQMFIGAGLGPANVYYVGSGRLSIHQLTANSVAFSMVGTVIGFLVTLLIVMSDLLPVLLPGVSSGCLMLAMIALPLGLLNSNLNTILQGLGRIFTLNILMLLDLY